VIPVLVHRLAAVSSSDARDEAHRARLPAELEAEAALHGVLKRAVRDFGARLL